MRRESNRRPIDPAEIMAANREDVPDSSSALALMSFLSDPATLVSLGVIAGGTAYYLLTRPPPVKPPIPLDNQSLELPGGDHVRVSHLSKNNELTHYRFEDAKTLYECFQRGKRVSSNGACLGWRPGPKAPYQWMTYEEVEERAMAFGSGLVQLGVEPGQDSFVGVYSQNTVDWIVVEQSCNNFSRVLVPLYDTLGPEAVSYIINQACITVVACNASKVALLFKQAESCPSLRLIIKLGGAVSEEEKEKAAQIGISIHSIQEVEDMGRENPADRVLPTCDDTATICYTSGTTGNPKGVIITHSNVVSNLAGAYFQLEQMFESTPDDIHISYLPLAHMFERVCVAMMFMCGAKVGFFQGDIKLLIEDIKELRPTIFVTVPRLLNRVYDRVINGVSASAMKKFLFDRAMASKLAELRQGIVRRDSIWDWLVFRRVQQSMGGRVRFIITGSAPISSKVMDFMRVAFGCQVFEGYGQTECTAGATMTLPGDCVAGHVGAPLPCNRVKLVDVKEMNYFAENGEGEVCYYGPNVFKGYLKDPTKTAEALDADGWLHSGDIGRWLPNGSLKIIDRKKHIFKLAQGEYIAPEKVENIYTRSLYVSQAYVYGDSLKSACVAIIVPDEQMLVQWAKDNSIAGNFAELCKNKVVNQMVLFDITQLGKDNGLHSFEQAKAIMLYAEPFTVENGFLTPTFKLKRPATKSHFMETFVQLYSQLPS